MARNVGRVLQIGWNALFLYALAHRYVERFSRRYLLCRRILFNCIDLDQVVVTCLKNRATGCRNLLRWL